MPGYRPPSREPRGTWARAIHEKRRRDGISQTGSFEVLGPRLGLGPKSRQSYINLDMGDREPTAVEAAVLAEWLGGYPVDDPSAGAAANTPADLIQALADQTAAISELAAQVKRLVDRPQTEAAAALVELVRLGLLSASPSGSPAAETQQP